MYDEENPDKNPQVLRKLATLSGGKAYFPTSAKNLDQVWRDIAGEIRSQYTIGYHPSDLRRDGRFRKVEITARRTGSNAGGLKVATRDGYFAPPASPASR